MSNVNIFEEPHLLFERESAGVIDVDTDADESVSVVVGEEIVLS